ncbi:MAG: hypothetical protein JST21_13935 [Bacteroidetes bacterium]|nr:hypothetical protein [Bacteroidota bacterium]
MKIIRIQNLVAIDRAIHGKKIVLLENLGAVLFCFGLGIYIINQAKYVNAIWMALSFWGIGFNYIPLFIYSVSKKSNLSSDSKLLSKESKKRYTIQSLFLLVPFLVFIIAVIQRPRRTVKE